MCVRWYSSIQVCDFKIDTPYLKIILVIPRLANQQL